MHTLHPLYCSRCSVIFVAIYDHTTIAIQYGYYICNIVVDVKGDDFKDSRMGLKRVVKFL